ncbi:MAG TPA: chemotaxis protein CheW, partial [Nitrosospira sp.]|nr:chemotaxis protein CheW [Nitrosospira sp.]
VPVPCTPAFVRGIVSVRGEILPVIDLKKFFELPEKELSDLSTLIVLHMGEIMFSILADKIVSVRRIVAADIQPPLPTLTGIRKNYVKGITSERLVVLDAAKLLMDESLVVEEQVGE